MAFLTKEELKTVSTLEVVNLITNTDDSIVVDIIDESIDLMVSYLFQYYDTEKIFSTTGNDRKKVILRFLKKIVIHEIYVRRSRVMNEVVKDGYDDAVAWLVAVGEGDLKADLPGRLIDSDGDGNPDSEATFMKLKSNKKYANHW